MRAPRTASRLPAYTAVAVSSAGPAAIMENVYSGAAAVEARLLAPDSTATKAPSSATSAMRPVRQRYDVTGNTTVLLATTASAPSLTTHPSALRSCASFVATSSTAPSNATLTPCAATSATEDTLSIAGTLAAPSTCSGTTAGVSKVTSSRSISSPCRSRTQPAGSTSVSVVLFGHSPLVGCTSSVCSCSATRSSYGRRSPASSSTGTHASSTTASLNTSASGAVDDVSGSTRSTKGATVSKVKANS